MRREVVSLAVIVLFSGSIGLIAAGGLQAIGRPAPASVAIATPVTLPALNAAELQITQRLERIEQAQNRIERRLGGVP